MRLSSWVLQCLIHFVLSTHHQKITAIQFQQLPDCCSRSPFFATLVLFAYLNSACTVLRTSLRHSYASIIATAAAAAAEIVRPLRLLSVAIWLTWTRSDRIRPSYVASRCIKRLCGSGSIRRLLIPLAHSGFVDSVRSIDIPGVTIAGHSLLKSRFNIPSILSTPLSAQRRSGLKSNESVVR